MLKKSESWPYPNLKAEDTLKRSYVWVLLTRLTMKVIPHDSMMTKYNRNTPVGGIITSPLGYISKIHLEYHLKLQYSTLPLNEKVILLTTSS